MVVKLDIICLLVFRYLLTEYVFDILRGLLLY